MKIKDDSSKTEYVLWVFEDEKYISFKEEQGYTPMLFVSWESMWKQVHQFVANGYKVS